MARVVVASGDGGRVLILSSDLARGQVNALEIKDWTVDQTCDFFQRCELDHAVKGVREDRVDGKTLLT